MANRKMRKLLTATNLGGLPKEEQLPPCYPGVFVEPRWKVADADEEAANRINQINEKRIDFDPQSAELSAHADEILKSVATGLEDFPEVNLIVEGHGLSITDTGQLMSSKRAEACARRLRMLGLYNDITCTDADENVREKVACVKFKAILGWLSPPQIRIEKIMSLRPIEFKVNSDIVANVSQKVLKDVASVLRESQSHFQITVRGESSSSRGQSIMQFLYKNGVPNWIQASVGAVDAYNSLSSMPEVSIRILEAHEVPSFFGNNEPYQVPAAGMGQVREDTDTYVGEDPFEQNEGYDDNSWFANGGLPETGLIAHSWSANGGVPGAVATCEDDAKYCNASVENQSDLHTTLAANGGLGAMNPTMHINENEMHGSLGGPSAVRETDQELRVDKIHWLSEDHQCCGSKPPCLFCSDGSS